MIRCVSGIFVDNDGKVLVQDHKKLDAYTLPGGKCDAFELECITIIREMQEELGVLVIDPTIIMIESFKDLEYPAHSGKYDTFKQTFYEIHKYEGTIENIEPMKHKQLLWIHPEEIRKLGKISVTLESYLKFLNL